jgi:hypothetical protein
MGNSKEQIRKLNTEYYPKISFYCGIIALIISGSPVILWIFWTTNNYFLFFIIPLGISGAAIVYGFISLGFTGKYRKKSKIGIIFGFIGIILFFMWYIIFFY